MACCVFPFTGAVLSACMIAITVATLVLMAAVMCIKFLHEKDVRLKVATVRHNESSRAHRWILGYVCHELRNPLHVLKSAANLLSVMYERSHVVERQQIGDDSGTAMAVHPSQRMESSSNAGSDSAGAAGPGPGDGSTSVTATAATETVHDSSCYSDAALRDGDWRNTGAARCVPPSRCDRSQCGLPVTISGAVGRCAIVCVSERWFTLSCHRLVNWNFKLTPSS